MRTRKGDPRPFGLQAKKAVGKHAAVVGKRERDGVRNQSPSIGSQTCRSEKRDSNEVKHVCETQGGKTDESTAGTQSPWAVHPSPARPCTLNLRGHTKRVRGGAVAQGLRRSHPTTTDLPTPSLPLVVHQVTWSDVRQHCSTLFTPYFTPHVRPTLIPVGIFKLILKAL